MQAFIPKGLQLPIAQITSTWGEISEALSGGMAVTQRHEVRADETVFSSFRLCYALEKSFGVEVGQ